jgi:gliding motility-associated-like protein
LKRSFYIILFILISSSVFSVKDTLKVSISLTNQICDKGAAGIQITKGKLPYTINWSTGATNVFSIDELDAGDYSVTVKDSTSRDTTITFKIEKENCPVIISNQFTPNGDNYNDTWKIENINNYPDFELFVYNRWGQQVHHQKNMYTPWNGEWLGITAADGTYYYVFYYKGSDKNKFLKGDVTILR